MLIDSPPGIFIFDTRSSEPGMLFSIQGMSTPSRFLLAPDGTYRIADGAGPLQCADINTGMLTSSGLAIAGLTLVTLLVRRS